MQLPFPDPALRCCPAEAFDLAGRLVDAVSGRWRCLDLPPRTIDSLWPIKTFGTAVLLGWLGVQLVNLADGRLHQQRTARGPHLGLGDMVVPVSMRTLKAGIVLMVVVYLVYQLGEGESLTRFLTALGVAGLAGIAGGSRTR